MAQRRHHYEQAFEVYLRSRRIPYVAVDEAKKALLPLQSAACLDARFGDCGGTGGGDASSDLLTADAPEGAWATRSAAAAREGPARGKHGSLKSFDFVLYGEGTNLLAEVKGRRVGRRAAPVAGRPARDVAAKTSQAGLGSCRLECWCTRDDVHSLQRWERLFGSGFEGALVFVYWCDEMPPDALFEEVFEHRDRWYAIRTVLVGPYARAMRTRSPKWGTVDVAPRTFDQICMPLAGRAHSSGDGSGLNVPPVPAMALLA
jgi:hypothetical protein